jgi:hypothetical protein
VLGSRQEIIPQYGEGFWFVIKAHPSTHIEICAGGCNAEDGPKDQQDVVLFFAEALKIVRPSPSATMGVEGEKPPSDGRFAQSRGATLRPRLARNPAIWHCHQT